MKTYNSDTMTKRKQTGIHNEEELELLKDLIFDIEKHYLPEMKELLNGEFNPKYRQPIPYNKSDMETLKQAFANDVLQSLDNLHKVTYIIAKCEPKMRVGYKE